jgi:hypothetical protein
MRFSCRGIRPRKPYPHWPRGVVCCGTLGWTNGPYWLDQPQGSFYADLDAVGEAVSEGDSFVDLGFCGYNRPPVPKSFTEA